MFKFITKPVVLALLSLLGFLLTFNIPSLLWNREYNKKIKEWNIAYNSLNYGRYIQMPNGLECRVIEAWIDENGQAWVRLYAGRQGLVGPSGHDFVWKDAKPLYPNFPKP